MSPNLGDLRGPGARGLTCSTLILAVFRRFRIELVNESDWPVREALDRTYLTFVERFAEPNHLQILRSEVDAGCVRIQPDEVVGACACDLPAQFEPTRAAADELVGRLDDQQAR